MGGYLHVKGTRVGGGADAATTSRFPQRSSRMQRCLRYHTVLIYGEILIFCLSGGEASGRTIHLIKEYDDSHGH